MRQITWLDWLLMVGPFAGFLLWHCLSSIPRATYKAMLAATALSVRRFLREHAKTFVLLFLPVVSCAFVLRMGKTDSEVQNLAPVGIAVLIITTTVAYVAAARTISRYIIIQEKQLHLAILVYLTVSTLVIVLCGWFGWFPYHLVEPTESAKIVGKPSELDALYFSTATFTTLGYGDFVPRGAVGRWLAMFEAALGTGHSVFFVMMYLKGGVPDKTEPSPDVSIGHASKPAL